MGNWLSTEPGMSLADIDHNPSSQRDDNRRGGEEAGPESNRGRRLHGQRALCTVVEKFYQTAT